MDERSLLVSIVTPSYNQGKFIRQTIESVLNQDYSHIEYWVLDGGSTDNTVSVLREYENDPRFHWISEKDKGQADAIRKGWDRCHGDILAWLNSDDTYLPGAISAVVDAFNKAPEAVGVYGECLYTDTEGNPWRQTIQGPVTRKQVLELSCSIDQPTVFVRGSDLRRVGGVDQTFHHQLDYELWLRLGFPHNFVYCNKFLATWRAHPDTKSISNTKRAGDELNRILQSAHDPKYHLLADEKEIFRIGATRRALVYLLADRIDGKRLVETLKFSIAHPSLAISLWAQILKTMVKGLIAMTGISAESRRGLVNNIRRLLSN